MPRINDYMVIDKNDNIVFIGKSKDCSRFMGITLKSFYVNVCLTKKGVFMGLKNYRAILIEDDEE